MTENDPHVRRLDRPDGHEADTHRSQLVSELAKRQHGFANARQLDELGIDASLRLKWCRTGRLHRVHRCVYAIAYVPRNFASRCMAAVLAVDGDAMVTGSAAAYLRGLTRHEPKIIDIVASRRTAVRMDGARVHFSTIDARDQGSVDGIPTASVARALVDQADHDVTTEIAAVMHEADFRTCLNLPAVRRCNVRRRTRRGRGYRRVAAALELHVSGSAGTQSRFERRALDRLLEGGAPMPEITPLLVIGRRRLRPDFLYRGLMLVIEIDGTPHDRNRTKNQDRIKTEELEAAGYRVRRVGYRTWRRDIDAMLREEFGCVS